jgi:hypothetical protein
MTHIERLEERIWRLQNSYGGTAYSDGLVSQEIAELERQIRRILNK